jgi:ABC-type nitrate/sulfonate/bicarbonate transport system substrate-binding protein
MANGKPRALFYVALLAIVAGLVWLGLSRFGARGAGGGGSAGGATPTEAADTGSVTTKKEYTYVAASRLPAAAGASNYKPMVNRTVRIALNVWAGWAPVILANNGFAAGKVWRTPGGQDFRVELVLIDDPVAMRDAYVSGNVHIGWATLDMLPLFVEQLRRDSRTMPRVFQQVDFSNGGDGIVVRENIKTMADLRGKKLVLAQNSPSQYFALNMLVAGGVQPSEVNMVYTDSAFQAATACWSTPRRPTS